MMCIVVKLWQRDISVVWLVRYDLVKITIFDVFLSKENPYHVYLVYFL